MKQEQDQDYHDGIIYFPHFYLFSSHAARPRLLGSQCAVDPWPGDPSETED